MSHRELRGIRASIISLVSRIVPGMFAEAALSPELAAVLKGPARPGVHAAPRLAAVPGRPPDLVAPAAVQGGHAVPRAGGHPGVELTRLAFSAEGGRLSFSVRREASAHPR